GASAVRQKTEIANAHETRRQYVQEKATQELTNLELRQSLLFRRADGSADQRENESHEGKVASITPTSVFLRYRCGNSKMRDRRPSAKIASVAYLQLLN